MENSDGLTIEAIVTLVDMVQTLPFMHRALCTLLGAIQGDSSIPAAALLEIFEVLRSANFMEPKHLAKMLVNVSRRVVRLALSLHSYTSRLHYAGSLPFFGTAVTTSLLHVLISTTNINRNNNQTTVFKLFHQAKQLSFKIH